MDGDQTVDDINEAAREEWRDNTTPYQRVKSVVSRTYEGKPATEIAERALVAETTARSHLEGLADDGFVETVADADSRATLYSRSWESLVLEQAQDMRQNVDSETLLTQVQKMQDELKEYRGETGLDDPEDLSWNDMEIDEETLLQWRTTRRNLNFAKVALALDQAEDSIRKTAV